MSTDLPDLTHAQALIFDCDGTLADTMPLHWQSWSHVAQRHGFTFPESRFYQLGGVPSADILHMIKAEQNLEFNPIAIAEEKESAYLDLLHLVKPIPEVVHIAQQFSGTLPMAVASGGTREVISKVLEHLGISHLFSAVITCEDVSRQKPAPDIFLKAAEKLNAYPRKCVGFEDSDLGMTSIRQAGMVAIHVNSLRNRVANF